MVKAVTKEGTKTDHVDRFLYTCRTAQRQIPVGPIDTRRQVIGPWGSASHTVHCVDHQQPGNKNGALHKPHRCRSTDISRLRAGHVCSPVTLHWTDISRLRAGHVCSPVTLPPNGHFPPSCRTRLFPSHTPLNGHFPPSCRTRLFPSHTPLDGLVKTRQHSTGSRTGEDKDSWMHEKDPRTQGDKDYGCKGKRTMDARRQGLWMQGDKDYGCKETRTVDARRQGLWMQGDKDCGCKETRTVDARRQGLWMQGEKDSRRSNDRKTLVDAMIDSRGCNDRLSWMQ